MAVGGFFFDSEPLSDRVGPGFRSYGQTFRTALKSGLRGQERRVGRPSTPARRRRAPGRLEQPRGLERWRHGRGQERSASLRCAARGRRRAAVNGPPRRHRRDACDVEPRRGCAGCRGMQSRAALLVNRVILSRVGIDGDVLPAPLWLFGDRCGSLGSIDLCCCLLSMLS